MKSQDTQFSAETEQKGGGGIMTYIKNGIGGFSAHKTKFQQSWVSNKRQPV